LVTKRIEARCASGLPEAALHVADGGTAAARASARAFEIQVQPFFVLMAEFVVGDAGVAEGDIGLVSALLQVTVTTDSAPLVPSDIQVNSTTPRRSNSLARRPVVRADAASSLIAR